MSNFDEMKSAFEKKLTAKSDEHAARLDADLRVLREIIPPLSADLPEQVRSLGANWGLPAAPTRQPLDISSSAHLRLLDEDFIQVFNLSAYFPTYKLLYPTVYCQTLEEFFGHLAAQMDISEANRQNAIRQQAQEAEASADKGGIFGFNLPGKGAYLNGWLFAHNTGFSPEQAFGHPAILRHILATAVHEKLGHGFLGVYSALGQVKTRLGLEQAELASRFGLRTADDPTSRLRLEQHNLIYAVSQFVEEGWSTWVERSIEARLTRDASPRRYTPQQVMEVLKSLPSNLPDRRQLQQQAEWAMVVLFGEKRGDAQSMLQAVIVLAQLGQWLDLVFSAKLGQPLRYVVGELFFNLAEFNLGPDCMPYLALVAANVTFDPSKLGLNDLQSLLSIDPRLHPDARLAMLSRLELSEKNNLREFAGRAQSELNLAIPDALKTVV
jgi:hypothetical protein